jgi:hypothetical protein
MLRGNALNERWLEGCDVIGTSASCLLLGAARPTTVLSSEKGGFVQSRPYVMPMN